MKSTTSPDLVAGAAGPDRRFGAHMPTTGGLHHAFAAGEAVGCDVIQIFTKNPQQWRARSLTDDQITRFHAAARDSAVRCLAAHDTYLINPAAADADLLEKSRAALADELERSSVLGIPNVVMHLGAAGAAPEEEALQRLAESVAVVLERTPNATSRLLLETTAGQGSCLGYRFEHLARVLEFAAAPERLGVCFDTCHVFVAGYDLRDEESYAATMAEFDARVGLRHVRLVHANDAKRACGSRVDRHDHVGKGEIGTTAFRLLLNDGRLKEASVVLETPKEGEMDPVNLAALRAAAGVI